jgi:ABC-2 type transport system ATP-binding protein
MQSENLSTDKTPAISFENVSLRIDTTTILNDITLDMPTHSISGILGPNGAGKSTLISLIVGLNTPSNGTLTVLGKQLPAKGESLRRQIGVVLQETSLYEELTIVENLLFFASLYNVEKPKQRIKEMLELLGLADRGQDQVRILSGGLKRRTAIARALLHNPQLLVVDEPTLGVDVEARHAIWEHLRFLKSQGHTILVATNYLDEAQALCDEVSVLHKGNLLITDSPDALIAKTGHSLDIECTPESAEKISQSLTEITTVVRSENTASGLSVFLKGETIPDTIINAVLKTAPVHGFRFRPPDLSEIFQTLAMSHAIDTKTEEPVFIPKPKNIFKRYPWLSLTLILLILGGLLILEVWFMQSN